MVHSVSLSLSFWLLAATLPFFNLKLYNFNVYVHLLWTFTPCSCILPPVSYKDTHHWI
jgi:hypothetical protein